MQTFTSAVATFLPVAYLLVTVAYGILFFSGHPAARRTATPVLRATILLHLAYLASLVVVWGQFPAASLSQLLSALAFTIAVLYAFLEIRSGERSTGFWLLSLAFVLQLFSSLYSDSAPAERELFTELWFVGHISLAIVGYTGLAMAAVYGFLFLRLYQELKKGRFETFYGRLPPLEVLEGMMAGALLVGFLALSGAVVSGAVWAQREVGGTWYLDPKTLLNFFLWLIYAAVLLKRRTQGWRGRTTALVCLGGFGLLLTSLVALSLVSTSFHVFQ